MNKTKRFHKYPQIINENKRDKRRIQTIRLHTRKRIRITYSNIETIRKSSRKSEKTSEKKPKKFPTPQQKNVQYIQQSNKNSSKQMNNHQKTKRSSANHKKYPENQKIKRNLSTNQEPDSKKQPTLQYTVHILNTTTSINTTATFSSTKEKKTKIRKYFQPHASVNSIEPG